MSDADDRHQPMRVTSVRPVADQIVLARLEALDGADVAAWAPGAHLEVRLPSGLLRPYSLCGDPADRRGYEIAVLREADGRGGSVEFHRDVVAGGTLDVGAPRNAFALDEAEDYLFVAGGVGITPMLPMVRHAQAAGASWRLVYGGRSRSTMAFVDTVAALAPERVAIHAEDEDGRPDLAALLADTKPDTLVYACGPTGMLDALVGLHEELGIAAHLHLERFSGEPVGDFAGAPFEVVAQRSGVSATVGPDETILGVLRRTVPGVPFSCEEGYCGTCEAEVLEGVPDHRDTYLDEEEREAGETIMICVSRCRGPRLVLDL